MNGSGPQCSSPKATTEYPSDPLPPEIPCDRKVVSLPPELYEAIIDHIDDYVSLQNCALVCHLFALRCQKALFHSIRLGRPVRNFKNNIVSTQHPSQRFLEIISNFPHLCGYVKELEITDGARLNFYREELSWIRKDRALHDILPKLDSLGALCIAGNPTGNRLNFRAWNPDLKLAILLKCHSSASSLTKIALTRVRNIPVTLFSHAPALESLYLFKAIFVPAEFPTVERACHRPKLKELYITTTTHNEWSSIYPWLLDEDHSLDLTSLTSLSLHVDFIPEDLLEMSADDINAISWIVHRSANTIKVLRLFYPEEVTMRTTFKETFLDLGSMEALRSLCLHGCVWSEQEPIGSTHSLQWLIDTLDRTQA
ncbi:hypothetical protein BDZ97DRAFT_91858 [Flammula alnicola]|nr:hypothetical protein BDZ97DRAFT_91858 [Flammula alnicola]